MVILLMLSITILWRWTDGNRPRNPTTTVPFKETILVLPYLGVQSKIVIKQLKTCINKFYGCWLMLGWFSKALIVALTPFFPTKIWSTVPKRQKLCIRLVVGTARISSLEKQNVDYMTEKLNILKWCQVRYAPAIADHDTPSTGQNLKWDHFEILAKGQSELWSQEFVDGHQTVPYQPGACSFLEGGWGGGSTVW